MTQLPVVSADRSAVAFVPCSFAFQLVCAKPTKAAAVASVLSYNHSSTCDSTESTIHESTTVSYYCLQQQAVDCFGRVCLELEPPSSQNE